MCIRDSAHAVRPLSMPAYFWKWRMHGGALELAEQARALLCLLYTSDAADERSSVDLGGRRIIKKKKEHLVRSIAGTTTRTVSSTRL